MQEAENRLTFGRRTAHTKSQRLAVDIAIALCRGRRRDGRPMIGLLLTLPYAGRAVPRRAHS